MKQYILCLLLILPELGSSQGFTLPTKILDSLLFETKLGRACEKVRLAQLSEIQLMDSALIIHVKQSQLYETVIANQNAIIEGYPKEISMIKAAHQKEIGKFKAKLRRLVRVIIIEGGVILVLILIL